MSTLYEREQVEAEIAATWGGAQPRSNPPDHRSERAQAERDARKTGRHMAAQAQRIAADRQAAYERRREEARTQPPEPPVGTVLETSDAHDRYRLERTADGWHLQYRDGEDEHGRRLVPGFGGLGISWRAAWAAWGEPAGAAPFREVPPDAPPLPARRPEDPPPEWGMGADASGQRLDPPQPAEPYRPPSRRRAPAASCPERPTVAPTSPGGTVSITDTRAQIMGGHAACDQALAQLGATQAALEDAHNALRQAAEGSHQAEADQADAQLGEAIRKVEEAKWQVGAALAEYEGVASRL